MNTTLKPDELPWVGMAERVLAGEFDQADKSTLDSLAFGLEGIPGHPVAAQALAKLPGLRKEAERRAAAQAAKRRAE